MILIGSKYWLHLCTPPLITTVEEALVDATEVTMRRAWLKQPFSFHSEVLDKGHNSLQSQTKYGGSDTPSSQNRYTAVPVAIQRSL